MSYCFQTVPEGIRLFSTGEIGDVFELTDIEWRIANIFSFIEDTLYFSYNSPTFSIENHSYNLRLFKGSSIPDEFYRTICVELENQEPEGGDFSLEYTLSMKKIDGSWERSMKRIFEKSKSVHDVLKLPDIQEINRRRSELAPSDVLIISLKPHKNFSRKKKSLQLINLNKLSQNFKDLFSDEESCDVVLKVMDREYKAHKSVLIARSKVFAANFKHNTLERQTGIITIEDCDPDSFQEFLEYLYCGKLERITYSSALSLYYTSDKYDVEELKAFCVESLLQYLCVENICEIVVFAEKYDVKELFPAVQNFFNEHASRIFKNPDWVRLMGQNSPLANKLLIEMSKVKL